MHRLDLLLLTVTVSFIMVQDCSVAASPSFSVSSPSIVGLAGGVSTVTKLNIRFGKFSPASASFACNHPDLTFTPSVANATAPLVTVGHQGFEGLTTITIMVTDGPTVVNATMPFFIDKAPADATLSKIAQACDTGDRLVPVGHLGVAAPATRTASFVIEYTACAVGFHLLNGECMPTFTILPTYPPHKLNVSGSALTVGVSAASADGVTITPSGNGLTFSPPSLTFTTSANLNQTWTVIGSIEGMHTITYALSGPDAFAYTVPPSSSIDIQDACFVVTNTANEDFPSANNWFDNCVDMATSGGTTITVTLQDTSNNNVYQASGSIVGTWTYDFITASAAAGTSQASHDHANHDRKITLNNGDTLMIPGQSCPACAGNGCGGSLGNGYGIVIFSSLVATYYQNIRLMVMPYRHGLNTDVRGFFQSANQEIAWDGPSGAQNSCGSLTAFLGTFKVKIS